LHNLTIFVTREKRVNFSEVTGVRVLSFRDVSMGEPAVPPMAGNAEGAKLPLRYITEKTSPPEADKPGSLGTEEKSIVSKQIGVMQRPRNPRWLYY